MESRGTGLRPQRPTGWERRPAAPLTQQSTQGPSQLRSAGGAQAPIPSQVTNVLGESPGGFITQIIAGRPGLEAERARPGNDGVFGGSGGLPSQNFGGNHGNHLVDGSASPHVTGGRGKF